MRREESRIERTRPNIPHVFIVDREMTYVIMFLIMHISIYLLFKLYLIFTVLLYPITIQNYFALFRIYLFVNITYFISPYFLLFSLLHRGSEAKAILIPLFVLTYFGIDGQADFDLDFGL